MRLNQYLNKYYYCPIDTAEHNAAKKIREQREFIVDALYDQLSYGDDDSHIKEIIAAIDVLIAEK